MAAKFATSAHDKLTVGGIAVPIGSTALTMAAFVVFAVLPLYGATWTIGRVPLPPAVRVALLGAMVLAIGLRYWAMRELGDFFSRTLNVVQGQRVVQTGPFRFVRHPGYAANMLLYWAASVAVAQNVLLLALTVSVFAMIWGLRISREEAMMLRVFPAEYSDYARRTARIIPFLV